MNTLEMALELRKNPKLKAQCNVGNNIWKVKCVNGNIMWDDNGAPDTLKMRDCILKYDNWVLIEEDKICEVYYMGEVELNKGIGELPKDKQPITDITVITSDGKIYTARPINKNFALPIEDKYVSIIFKYNVLCNCVYVNK